MRSATWLVRVRVRVRVRVGVKKRTAAYCSSAGGSASSHCWRPVVQRAGKGEVEGEGEGQGEGEGEG